MQTRTQATPAFFACAARSPIDARHPSWAHRVNCDVLAREWSTLLSGDVDGDEIEIDGGGGGRFFKVGQRSYTAFMAELLCSGDNLESLRSYLSGMSPRDREALVASMLPSFDGWPYRQRQAAHDLIRKLLSARTGLLCEYVMLLKNSTVEANMSRPALRTGLELSLGSPHRLSRSSDSPPLGVATAGMTRHRLVHTASSWSSWLGLWRAGSGTASSRCPMTSCTTRVRSRPISYLARSSSQPLRADLPSPSRSRVPSFKRRSDLLHRDGCRLQRRQRLGPG